jgi:predicted NUDIX family NTP pyrophosphohydrolase
VGNDNFTFAVEGECGYCGEALPAGEGVVFGMGLAHPACEIAWFRENPGAWELAPKGTFPEAERLEAEATRLYDEHLGKANAAAQRQAEEMAAV